MREKILDAAVKLFLEKGIGGISTRDLANYLGISRSHIYHYFRDWKSLSIEAVEWFINSEIDRFRGNIEKMSPIDKLKALVNGVISDRPDPARILYNSLLELANTDDEFRRLGRYFFNQWQNILKEIIQSGIDSGVFRVVNAERLARQLDAMLIGYGWYLENHDKGMSVPAVREDVNDFIHRNLLLKDSVLQGGG